MKEKPSHSSTEIRMLLSQYLDGALEPADMAEVAAMIEQDPAVRSAFLKLQALRNRIQASLGAESETGETQSSLWSNISRQLETDGRQHPIDADSELLSAYHDQELSTEERQVLESQLYQNEEASRMLADIGQVSETVRQFGYRLENACTLDIAADVMAIFAAEQGLTVAMPTEADSLDPTAEMLSAYVDQALSPRETIEANRHIENDPAARIRINRFHAISERLQSIGAQIGETAPDFWPAIQQKLEAEPILSFDVAAHKRRQRLRVIIPVAAAAAVLLVLALPRFQQDNTPADNNFEGRQLASVPTPAAVGQSGLIWASSSREAAASKAGMGMDSAAPAESPQTPVPEIAIKPDTRSRSDALGEPSHKKTPSSDEYLFQALSEEMPDEDISTILGQ